jgi:hypothetical protein
MSVEKLERVCKPGIGRCGNGTVGGGGWTGSPCFKQPSVRGRDMGWIKSSVNAAGFTDGGINLGEVLELGGEKEGDVAKTARFRIGVVP